METPKLNGLTLTDQMLKIPQGKITLNDDRIKRRWTVEIQPFLLCKYLVTQDIYFAITKEAPSTFQRRS